MMKPFSLLIYSGLSIFILFAACSSKEEEKASPPAPALKFSIIRPIKKAVETPLEAPRPVRPILLAKKAPEPKALPPAKVTEKVIGPAIKRDAGYYLVKKGDNLLGVAALPHIYNDPLKWTVLLRSNMEQLIFISAEKRFPEQELPKGIKLKVFTSDTIQENIRKRLDKPWVVNVASVNASRPLDPLAFALVKKGYCVYITKVRIEDQDWYRLRVGFFADQAAANDAGHEISDLLQIKKMWVTRIPVSEFNEFAGLFIAS